MIAERALPSLYFKCVSKSHTMAIIILFLEQAARAPLYVEGLWCGANTDPLAFPPRNPQPPAHLQHILKRSNVSEYLKSLPEVDRTYVDDCDVLRGTKLLIVPPET